MINRLGILGLLATTALVTGCASDAQQAALTGQAINASATANGSVDNFMLVDANLEAHELYRMNDASAVVHGHPGQRRRRDPRPRAAIEGPVLDSYGAKGVEFRLLNSSLKDSREAILAEASSVGYAVPVLLDAKPADRRKRWASTARPKPM